MKEVRLSPFSVGGHTVQAILYYNDNDLVERWDLLYNNLNLSRMTYAQVYNLTGLTRDDILSISRSIQTKINHTEGRK